MNEVELDVELNATSSEPYLTVDDKLDAIMAKLLVVETKVNWCGETLQWMISIFQGMQSMARMMPGKLGKMAREMQSGGSDG